MDQVRGVANPLGYDRILMFSYSPVRDELVDGIYWSEGSWSDDDDDVNAETFIRQSPITRRSLETDDPFFWSEEDTRKGRQYRFGEARQGAKLCGLEVPAFSHNGLAGAVRFAGERIDSSVKSRLVLTEVGTSAFLAARKLTETAQPDGLPLSAREVEVLKWIASGQRVVEVAKTLGLSDRTVENHLRRIRKRLQVKTTAQAINAAIRSGALSDNHTQGEAE